MATQRVTIAQLAANPNYPFTEPSLRWMVFNARQNGLAAAGAITRVGRRVLINMDAFERWIDSQQEEAA